MAMHAWPSYVKISPLFVYGYSVGPFCGNHKAFICGYVGVTLVSHVIII